MRKFLLPILLLIFSCDEIVDKKIKEAVDGALAPAT